MELGGAAGRALPGPRQLDLILQKWRLGSWGVSSTATSYLNLRGDTLAVPWPPRGSHQRGATPSAPKPVSDNPDPNAGLGAAALPPRRAP